MGTGRVSDAQTMENALDLIGNENLRLEKLRDLTSPDCRPPFLQLLAPYVAVPPLHLLRQMGKRHLALHRDKYAGPSNADGPRSIIMHPLNLRH